MKKMCGFRDFPPIIMLIGIDLLLGGQIKVDISD